ncbi:MAG TPA: hypothetical protein VFC39_12430 [Acidobacteriaceae bacterium]|nr:hypothetical protein [Acidobacteriaceae bacterium]
MQTDAKDYLYCAGLIGLAAAGTTCVVALVQPWFLGMLGPYAPVALFFLFAMVYGGFTAFLLAVIAKWLPLREGEYSMNDSQFTLWKVQHVVGEFAKLALSLFFPVVVRPAFYALFGARVGTHVAVAGKILDPRMTILEAGCVLGEGCILTSHAMAGGRFILRGIRVGKGATVGVGSILMPGVTIGAGAVVLPGSVLKSNTTVPADETWGGVPAVRIAGSAVR